MYNIWPEYQTSVFRDGKEVPITVHWEGDGGSVIISWVFGPEESCDDLFELTKKEEQSVIDCILCEIKYAERE